MPRRTKAALKFPKPTKKKKLTAAKVQVEFNKMIVRRDGKSVLSGSKDNLQASHFFSVGGNGALRFYPPNVHAMTAGEHRFGYHGSDTLTYTVWMQDNVPELPWMAKNRTKTIRYGQPFLRDILTLCKMDSVEELTQLIEKLLWTTK